MTLEFENFLLGYNGLKLEIKSPTRPLSGSCLDNFAHNLRQTTRSQILDLDLSDHTAQVLKIPIKKVHKIDFWRTAKRDYAQEYLDRFRSYLEALSFCEIYGTSDPNVAYDSFTDTFKLLYDLCFPIKNITIRTKPRIKWISKGIKACSLNKKPTMAIQTSTNHRKESSVKKLFKNL